MPTEEELEDRTVAVLDVGGRFDPDLNNFDHHQGNVTPRTYLDIGGSDETVVPYSSFGLVARTYAHLDYNVADRFDKLLVQGIDAADNGIGPDGDQWTRCDA